ncbi:MAG: hypothetical protein MZV64_26885 [Ignavibacteriales bacterium]|nr:hypothetical protein [Ignavibacteriales bacterium]
MPDYLAHTAVQLIELNDTKSGNTIGNAVCYMAKDKENKPLMVIDNVEMAPGYQNIQEIREGITLFAHNYSKAVAKGKDVPIYMGQNYNDVPESDLKSKGISFNLIGKTAEDKLYLDSIDGWSEELDQTKTSKLYVLRK